ncbi:uncharacterized protein [Leptinotarsa decemlineata]|uniref:uncharacterized protein n=1 Tax=Leptinotarsa decemlineata TaxID=7539 RepID=UPI003D30D0CB
MAYSQKHKGKVLVPWFNSEEWRTIYSMLLTKTRDNYEKAVRIMKIWKIRTPLLSAGIEGTIIILEALLCDELNLSKTQLINTYTVSLLRFCNICAGNNEKQGTFNRTVSKRGLPEWIIDIRHDIAHGHKLPSKCMLKLALEESLDWLMEKYWAVQNEKLKDFIVPKKKIDPLHMYMNMKLDVFRDANVDQYDEACLEKLNNLISKKKRKSKSDINGFLTSLEKVLKQSFAHSNRQIMGTKVAQILASKNGLLSTNLELTDENEEVIPQEFREIWSDLLNIIFETGFLFYLLNELLEVTNNSEWDKTYRKIASLWIIEIFSGISRLQIEDSGNISEQFYEEAKSFEENILMMPNQYTVLFLESVMKFNRNPEKYIDHAKLLTESLIPAKNTTFDLTRRVYTADDLFKAINLVQSSPPNVTEERKVTKTGRWNRIEDTSIFKGLPLGVLPGQDRNNNPLLQWELDKFSDASSLPAQDVTEINQVIT